MNITFERAQGMYKDDRLSELASAPDGLRFLLLKSLDRPEYSARLGTVAALKLADLPARSRLRALFDSAVRTEDLRSCIAEIYLQERAGRRDAEKSLVAELYKMKSFDWGGLHQNSLEKTIIDNYVKKIPLFDRLNECIDTELLSSMRGYVQCSWYNHWTSILIEDLCKDQPRVTPAVGLIKKIDFFIDDTPFDLKVTYLPEGFIKERRRDNGLRPEVTVLKGLARTKSIPIDGALPEGRLLEQLWFLLHDMPDTAIRGAVADLDSFRKDLVTEVAAKPDQLIRWLYENQGIRRFDSSNRLFLVLVNTKNYFESWKLKRAHSLLARDISAFLADGSKRKVGREIEFVWEGKTHRATSDLLVVQHDT
jgi:hypothetical protein